MYFKAFVWGGQWFSDVNSSFHHKNPDRVFIVQYVKPRSSILFTAPTFVANLKIFYKYINHVDSWGRRVLNSQMTIIQNSNPYLVKASSEGVENPENLSTWFVYGPLTFLSHL